MVSKYLGIINAEYIIYIYEWKNWKMQTLKYVSKASKITFISCKYITDGITRHIVGTLAG